jgi:hypothetical protein
MVMASLVVANLAEEVVEAPGMAAREICEFSELRTAQLCNI